jgi:hypothetical protein
MNWTGLGRRIVADVYLWATCGVTERNCGTGGGEMSTESSEVKVDSLLFQLHSLKYTEVKVKVASVSHKGIWGGDITSHILNLGTGWR